MAPNVKPDKTRFSSKITKSLWKLSHAADLVDTAMQRLNCPRMNRRLIEPSGTSSIIANTAPTITSLRCLWADIRASRKAPSLLSCAAAVPRAADADGSDGLKRYSSVMILNRPSEFEWQQAVWHAASLLS